MYRFFVDKNQISDKQVIITGSDYNHIRNVLRMKEGEELSCVVDGDDKEYRCIVKEYVEESAILEIIFIKLNDVELPCQITLLQGLPKADKMELIIQKAVELGVSEVVPVAMKRSVVKLDKGKEDKKINRWNGISEAAAKQSKRAIIPDVTNVMSVKEAIDYCKNYDVKLLPYEMADYDAMDRTRSLMESIRPGEKIAIFIGPEGGFEDSEVGLSREAGFETITLGHRILRTETAGFTVLSWLVLMLDGKL